MSILVASSSAALALTSVGDVSRETAASAADFLSAAPGPPPPPGTSGLKDWAGVAVVRSLSAQSAFGLAQTARTGRPWYADAETPIQTAGYQYDPQTSTFSVAYEGLHDATSVARPLATVLPQPIPLSQSASAVRVKPTAIGLSAVSGLELRGEVHPSPTGDTRNWLTLAQTGTADKCKTAKSALALAEGVIAARTGLRGAASILNLEQAVTFSIAFAGVVQQYAPFVGTGTAGAPAPPPVVLRAPEHCGRRFQLFFPVTGTVSDSVTLRTPNLGNKDRLSFNRIVRESRGGTLIVFADPMWPKLETLVLSFSGLCSAQARQLLAFQEAHLGEEIGLLDWEGRCWKGVITTPANPVVQDGRDSFSASIEFEGDLNESGQPPVVPWPPYPPRVPGPRERDRASVPRWKDQPLPLLTEDSYDAEADSAVAAGQAVWIKSSGHVDLARADQLMQAVGIAITAAQPGFLLRHVMGGKVTLADWTVATGAAFLTPGSAYYLGGGAAGHITTTPPASGYVVRVGQATAALTLDVEIEPPIRL